MLARPLTLAAIVATAALTLALACDSGDDAPLGTGNDDSSATPSTAAPDDPTPTPEPDTPISSTPTPTDPRPPDTSTPGTPPSTNTPPPEPTPSNGDTLPPPPGVVERLADIVSVELAIAESFPPQYFVSVVSAQPDGCHRFSHFEVQREGTLIEISVYNTVPENLAVVSCIALYGETTSNVALGSDFEPGETYTFSVNGEQQTFVAQ